MAKRRNRIPKPFNELTRSEQIAECKAAIGRLRASINRNFDNRNLYDAIKRWNETLKRLGETEI